ncbi:MAG: AMP-binding protein [Acidimicrobiales bacterium]
MYPGHHARERGDQPAFVMASTGETVSYGEYEARTDRLAHLLVAHGLRRLDHYSIFMENNDRYLESCGAGERAGLYYTCVNSFLTAPELAYILNNSESKVLITSRACCHVAVEALRECPDVTLCLVVDLGAPGDEQLADFATATSAYPDTPIENESLGTPMLYSSGTTGRPKGILRPLEDVAPETRLPVFVFLDKLWGYREDMTYLSPAPLYHSAPQAAVNLAIRRGGTVIIMEKFDPETYLQLVERYGVTHSQLVPTMFSRMLKLAPDVRSRYDLSSLEVVVHAAAPCPVPVKQEMIAWWGPIIVEYYGATEAIGFTACDSQQWLDHPGTVGKVLVGELHILDPSFEPVPLGTPGTLWFKPGTEFRYFNDTEKTAESTSPDGTMVTVGDIGYLDEDGYLYLTDRATFMIISGGVNIYPQECENLLVTHPKVADAAVFGIPNADLGEEVKAVVQLMDGVEPGPATEAELIAFCRGQLAHMKCPRSVDFVPELPRLPTGKLYKRLLRDRYWGNNTSRIV